MVEGAVAHQSLHKPQPHFNHSTLSLFTFHFSSEKHKHKKLATETESSFLHSGVSHTSVPEFQGFNESIKTAMECDFFKSIIKSKSLLSCW